MYCKSCGESLTLGAQFCGKCGTLVAVAKSAGLRCPKCGAINPPAAKFCRQDGTSLVDAQVTSQEPHADAPSGDNAPRIWLVLGALAVLVCAGGGYWYYKNRSTSPQLKETALVEGSQAPATPSAPLSQQSDVPEGPPTPAPNTEGTITATSQLDGDAKRRAEEQYAKWKADYMREDGILEYAPSNVLIRAVFEDRSDVAEIAIGKGANVNASDGIPDAWSPLVFDAPSIMMLELLYSKGAALNGRNYLGQGLLHRYREPEMVEFVLA